MIGEPNHHASKINLVRCGVIQSERTALALAGIGNASFFAAQVTNPEH